MAVALPMADPAHPGPQSRVWIGDLIAAILVAVPAFIPFPGQEFRPGSVVSFVVVLLPAVFLPLRRRWPIPVLGVCIALYGTAAFMGTLAPGLVLATAITMFGVANRMPRRTTLIVAAAAALAVGVLSLLAALGSVFDPRVVQFVIAIAFASAAGDATRSRREYILAITERAIRAEATKESEAKRRVTEERLRIARDLHDVVAHQIAVISLNAGVASASLESRPDKARASLATIRTASRSVLHEIGDLLAMLRADAADSADSFTPQPGLDRLDELLATFAESGLDVDARVTGSVALVSETPGLVAYRVIQEALTNAHKHGSDGRARVMIDVTEHAARIVVTNPGPPPDGGSSGSMFGTGHGLVGLRERVASVRGVVETGFTGGQYRVVATLPLTLESNP